MGDGNNPFPGALEYELRMNMSSASWVPLGPEPEPDMWALFRQVHANYAELLEIRRVVEDIQRRYVLEDYARLTAAWRARRGT